jgi:hypothetical protein
LATGISEEDHAQGPAYAAVQQTDFWTMHDYRFEHQNALKRYALAKAHSRHA